MRELTFEEKQRLWKLDTPPIRKLMLWGRDSRKNPCLLILYGEQEIEEEIKSSPRAYYAEAYLLKPSVVYTKYAVFHGMNGHLPSIPNTYYYKEKDLICYTAGYKTAKGYWDYDEHGYEWIVEIEPKYIIKSYDMGERAAFRYYGEQSYSEYVSYLKDKNIRFQDCELIEHPGDLFGFEPDHPYMQAIIPMCSKERLYTRRKYLKQFMDMQPSVEDYDRLLQVASVELACGIFQELTEKRSPILLETAKRISESGELWDKAGYHSGLTRCIRQYLHLFDEKRMEEQKTYIYETLPEMDLHIKKLCLRHKVLEGRALEEYLSRPHAYQKIPYYDYDYNGSGQVFGGQKLYEKSTYTDGTNLYNTKFKDTIQMAKAYGMADAIGKIAYYLDAPRTPAYLKGSGRSGAFHYYQRYLRRTLDEYRASDEQKFITAAREMLTSYTDLDDQSLEDEPYFEMNYFFRTYFQEVILDQEAAEQSIWNRYREDVVYIARHAKAQPVHEFCYALLKRAYDQQTLEACEMKELIMLADIPYEKTAGLFKNLLFAKLEALQEFDGDVMVALMNTRSEELWQAAQSYFKRTNGKFQPQHLVEFLFMDTIEAWYGILEENIKHFTAEECSAFLKSLAAKREEFLERQIKLSEETAQLLQEPVAKLEAVTAMEQKELFLCYGSLVLQGTNMPDFLFGVAEAVLFGLPYKELKNILEEMDLGHGRLAQRAYDVIALLESLRTDRLPKDSVLLSVLETGSSRLVKTLTQIAGQLREQLTVRTAALMIFFECNVYHLNQIAQSVFEGMPDAKREQLHMLLLDSPLEQAYRYGIKKLDDWYGNKVPKSFIVRMMEHPCVEVKAYLSKKMEQAFADLKDVDPDLYLYYVKTLLYLPNQVSKSKEEIYHTIPVFLYYYPQRQPEIEALLLDIGSTNSKINSERALVALAGIRMGIRPAEEKQTAHKGAQQRNLEKEVGTK
ncbi:MAG: hypothetical protein HFI75_04170 [Lachnospiraceae bacterium]|nr:hypothetical protein [Lachnospiraceae bacterium]